MASDGDGAMILAAPGRQQTVPDPEDVATLRPAASAGRLYRSHIIPIGSLADAAGGVAEEWRRAIRHGNPYRKRGSITARRSAETFRLNYVRKMVHQLRKLKADAAACAGQSEVCAFALGQSVECRGEAESESQSDIVTLEPRWRRGVVTSQHPLEVEIGVEHLRVGYDASHLYANGCGWDEVRCRCSATLPVRCSAGCALGHLLPQAVKRREVHLVYYLLSCGVPVDDRVFVPRCEDADITDDEDGMAHGSLMDMGGRTAIELVADGAYVDHHEACSDAWVLAKLLLLAGSAGNPWARGLVGLDMDHGNESIYNHTSWTRYLEPLFAVKTIWIWGQYTSQYSHSIPTTASASRVGPAACRTWWLSHAGAHARWKAHGGDLLCVLECLAKPAAPAAKARRRAAAEDTTFAMALQQTAQLPKPIRRLVAVFARPTRAEAVTELFRMHVCGGEWDEAAFQAI